MRIWFAAFALIALSSTARAATECNASIQDAAGYRILQVISDGRWAAGLGVGSPVKRGDPYTQANVELAKAYVKQQLDKQNNASLNYFTRVSVVMTEPCTIVEPAASCQHELSVDKCVTIKVKTLALRLPAADTSSLLPNRPRSPNATDLDGVPRPIVATAPSFGIENDAGMGATVKFRSSTDLAMLGSMLKGDALSTQRGAQKYKAILTLDGSRALNAPYYSAYANFTGARLFHSTLKQVAADVSLTATRTPKGTEDLRSNNLLASTSATFGFDLPVFRSVLVGGGYTHASQAFVASTPSSSSLEDGFIARLSDDGMIHSSPLRLAAWYQHNWVDSNATYTKILLRSGFQQSLALRPHQTIDVELLAGYGRAYGKLPVQDQFVGGNAGAGFLQDPIASTTQAVVPAGPILRSFGAGKLDWSRNSTGVDSQTFDHFNLTLAFPIGLSRPLLPEIQLDPGVTVADMLKRQVDNNHLLEQTLILQGMSPSAAAAEQKRVMKAISPAVHFIADQANIWSIKPVALFDYAHTWSRPQLNSSEAWPAGGGGIQLTIVTAQFQAGYIHSFDNGQNPGSGNFILRLTFQNLF